jgi:hypothetical protein
VLYESFEHIEKIRILVRLNVDRKTFEIIDHTQGQLQLNFESHQQTQQAFSNGLAQESARRSSRCATRPAPGT